MINGLKADKRLYVQSGIDDRFFGILRTAIVQRPDYIHFDWETSYYYRRQLWMSLLNLPLFILQILIVKYILGITLVWTPHNIVPHDLKSPGIHKFCRRFFGRNMSWIRLFSEKSIAVAASEFECDPLKFKVVPEGSYVDYYPNRISKEEARSVLNLDFQKKVILFLGFIRPYKGIDTLLKVFKKKTPDNTMLIIAGEVKDPEYFEQLAREQNQNIVFFDRFIHDDELQIFFNAADVVALPFRKVENSGSVILAMGFKKAVIAPKTGSVKERLKLQPELLYQKSLEESLFEIENFDENRLRQIGINNFHSLKDYTWDDFAKCFL